MQEKSTKTTPVIQLNLIFENPNKLGFLEQSECRRTVLKVRQEYIWFAMQPNHQINLVMILDWVNFTVVIRRYHPSYKSPCVT